MTLFEFYRELRSDILEAINGVISVNPYSMWDDTSTNSQIRSKLKKILSKYTKTASEYGVRIVTSYNPVIEYDYSTMNPIGQCENPNHAELDQQDYIYMMGKHSIAYKDHNFHWIFSINQGVKYAKCPCSEDTPVIRQHIGKHILIDKNFDQKTGEIIASILSDIYCALNSAGDKMPRSGIREYLLRTALKLNDAILPQPIDEFIAFQTQQNSIEQSVLKKAKG